MPEVRIKNYMEDCVNDLLEVVLAQTNSCTCEKCLYDITAIALNSLPSKYVVTRRGNLYTKLAAHQQQFNVDTIAAITKAVGIVNNNPRHGEE